MPELGTEIWPEVCQHFAEAGFGQVRQIESAEAMVNVVEPMAEAVQLERRKFEWTCVIANSPQQNFGADFGHA